jgi:hypothetical protein
MEEMIRSMSSVWLDILSLSSLSSHEQEFEVISPEPTTRVRFAPSVIQSMKDFYDKDCNCRKATLSNTCVSFTETEVEVKADFYTGSAVIQYFLAMSICKKK